MTNRRKVGMTSSHHGLYDQGYTRATMVGTEGSQRASLVEISGCSSENAWLGAAWLSSARVVRCWVKSRNERNPYH